MKNLMFIFIIIISVVVAIYHIKTTNYPMTVYLVQIGAALLTFRIILAIQRKRNNRKELPK